MKPSDSCIYCGAEVNMSHISTCPVPGDRFVKDGGKKFDGGKPKLSFVTRSLLVAIATVMEPGAVKYGRDNWRQGMLWSRPYDALLRHLIAWWGGEHIDPESGKSHLWHAACELMFLIEYEATATGQDDRYKMPPEGPFPF